MGMHVIKKITTLDHSGLSKLDEVLAKALFNPLAALRKDVSMYDWKKFYKNLDNLLKLKI